MSLGFSSGSGPENTGYKMLPQMKWIICYTAYPFLQAGIIVGENLKIRWKDIPKSIRENIIFLRIISLLLIFVAARHSSLVDYNADGMLKLLGRYVTYIVLIEIIIYAITEKYKKEEKAIDRFFRILLCYIVWKFCLETGRGLACITSRSGESCISEVGLYICNRNLYFDSSVTSIWEENYSDMLVAFCRS